MALTQPHPTSVSLDATSAAAVPEPLRLLFWDLDTQHFDPRAYPRYAIERVLEFGDGQAVTWMKSLFTDSEVVEVLRASRRLSRRSANYWSLVYRVPRTNIRALAMIYLQYPYPTLFPTCAMAPLAVLDPRDIACMKLQAIATRGARRDFMDLYVVAQEYGLPAILDWCDRKFSTTPYNEVHVRKALTYFEDAEIEPAPDMLVDLPWARVRAFFESAAL